MTKSRFASLLFAAAALCLAAASASYHYTVDLVCSTARAVKNLALDGFKMAANTQADKAAIEVPLIQAKEFHQRIIKRERPVVSTNWNMIPST